MYLELKVVKQLHKEACLSRRKKGGAESGIEGRKRKETMEGGRRSAGKWAKGVYTPPMLSRTPSLILLIPL